MMECFEKILLVPPNIVMDLVIGAYHMQLTFYNNGDLRCRLQHLYWMETNVCSRGP